MCIVKTIIKCFVMWFGVKQQKAVSKQNDNDDAYGVAQWEILAFFNSLAF